MAETLEERRDRMARVRAARKPRTAAQPVPPTPDLNTLLNEFEDLIRPAINSAYAFFEVGTNCLEQLVAEDTVDAPRLEQLAETVQRILNVLGHLNALREMAAAMVPTEAEEAQGEVDGG